MSLSRALDEEDKKSSRRFFHVSDDVISRGGPR